MCLGLFHHRISDLLKILSYQIENMGIKQEKKYSFSK